jgi:hypothetical protein
MIESGIDILIVIGGACWIALVCWMVWYISEL